MPISNANEIDLTMSKDDSVYLAIVDHLPWSDEKIVDALVPKLNCYVNYIVSGQLVENVPDAKDKPVGIILVSTENPEGRFRTAVEGLAELLAEHGIAFGLEKDM